MLGYRSMKRLNVKEGSRVEIESAKWYCYLWNHAEATVKWPFRFALVVAVVSIVLTMLGFFF